MLKLGLFGGTFNPVHHGHLINAAIVGEACSLDRIVFIPSKTPVHKKLAGSVSPEQRYRMIELALKGDPRFSVSDIEITRKRPSFTIFTVREIRERYGDADVHLIIGEDSYEEIHAWRDYRDLLDLVTLVVMRRRTPGRTRRNPHAKGARAVMVDNPIIDISSSCIRDRIRRGQSVRYLLPEAVRRYIEDMGLYRE